LFMSASEEASLLHGDKIVEVHKHGHGHSHEPHGHSHNHEENFLTRLKPRWLKKEVSFQVIAVITLLYSVAELAVASIPPSSLTLLSDGFHNLSDVVSLGIAYYASRAAKRAVTEEISFGYGRLEVLGGLTNAIFLLSLCLYVLLEAIPRLISPPAVVDGISFIIIAGIGLLVNTIGTIVFGITGQAHAHSHGGGHGHGAGGKEDHNLKAVFLHYLGDMFSSLFVLIAGVIIHFADGKQWVYFIDPISSLIIIVLIIYITVPLVKSCFAVLLQQAPAQLDVRQMKLDLMKVNGIVGIHDFHVWQFVDSLDISSIHISYEQGADEEEIVSRVKQIFHENNLHSSTIQLEQFKSKKITTPILSSKLCKRMQRRLVL